MRRHIAVAFVVLVGGVAAATLGQCPEEVAKLIASDGGPGDEFGIRVRVSGDVAVVGAWRDDTDKGATGSAYVYRRNGSTWIEEAKLLAHDAVDDHRFGFSVSISGDVAVVGATGDAERGSFAGSAYVYRYNGSKWIEEAKLLASDGDSNHIFGASVSVSGDVAVVGAHGATATYVYRFNGSMWIEEAKLIPSDGVREDRFGFSVSISGDDVAVVGARHDEDNGSDSGSAFVYRYNGSKWIQEAKLLAHDGAAEDEFGYSVCVTGNVAVVGARWDDDNGENNSGSAYVYRHDGSTWIEEAKLLASDAATLDEFGISVSVSGDMAIVGASLDDTANGADSGSAYVYRHSDSIWSEEAKLLASDGAGSDEFGRSVSVSGDVAVVGAYRNHTANGATGSAYVFDIVPPCAETICPDDPNDFFRQFGGAVTGDALDLCASDDVRLDVVQTARLSPLLPFIRLEFWAHSTLADNQITSVDYTIECHVSALVSGGQNPDTLRTFIRNYTGGFEMIDQRGTSANTDEVITHWQTTNAPDYVNAGDGEVRVKQEVFSPGDVFSPNWFLKVDLYEVVVGK